MAVAAHLGGGGDLLWPWLLLSILIEILCKPQGAFSEDYPIRGVRHNLLIFHCAEHAFDFIKRKN